MMDYALDFDVNARVMSVSAVYGWNNDTGACHVCGVDKVVMLTVKQMDARDVNIIFPGLLVSFVLRIYEISQCYGR